jgi:twitching motility protein PilT
MEVFQSILHAAAESGASDVHLKIASPVMFRISGELVSVEAPEPTEAWMSEILRQIVPEGSQERLAREHEVDFAYDAPTIGRFRANVFQERGNHVMALRFVKAKIRSFEELNLPDVVRKVAEAHRGIVLLTGATGSGKSTTLAAMIEHLNTTAKLHIITFEDPIEYLFKDKLCVIEQREIGIDTMSFGSGLKNVLRQDPDVIVIGEMRDSSSVMAAMSAANTGHLVIATLHTGDAPKAVQRILEFFPGPEREGIRQQFASTLNSVICQRLVRTPGVTLLPALEILLNNAGVSKIIHGGQLEKLSAAIELGIGDGMQTFDQALYDLTGAGQITQAEALANSPNPEALKMRFQGVILNETRRIIGARG